MMLAIGPIALLCISKTLEKGRLAGITIGLGAATADGIYGVIAAFSLTIITSTLVEYEIWIRLIGGLFLTYLGIITFIPKLATKKVIIKEAGLIKNYLTTLFLTLTSPMTILLFVAIFAGVGIGEGGDDSYLNSSMIVIGIFLGSAMFYIILSSFVAAFRSKMTERHMAWGNKLSGMIIGGFGIAAIASLV